MNDKDTIQALKENEKPFGLMTAEMQEKAQDIGQQEFSMYMKDDTWFKCGGYDNFGTKKVTEMTYRLRPDYRAEPEIVEIPIDPPSHSLRCLSFQKDDNIRPLYAAPEYPDFIGFKFQDDTVSGFLRMYRGKSGGASFNAVPYENLDRYEVLTPTHVLFREVK